MFLNFKQEAEKVYSTFGYDVYLVFFETFKGNCNKVSYISVLKFYYNYQHI